MSEEKPSLDDVLRKIDELLDILRMISEDLKEVSVTLKSIKPSTPVPSPFLERLEREIRLRTIDDVQRVFPRELVGMLYFEEKGDYILIRAREELGA